jgi:hypothetical protein
MQKDKMRGAWIWHGIDKKGIENLSAHFKGRSHEGSPAQIRKYNGS